VQAVAAEADATPAQVALAWLLAQGDDIAPIPGTKRVSRVEENTAADQLELSADQLERLNNLTPAAASATKKRRWRSSIADHAGARRSGWRRARTRTTVTPASA